MLLEDEFDWAARVRGQLDQLVRRSRDWLLKQRSRMTRA